MLELDRWDSVLSTATGAVYRGTERVATATLLNLLQCGEDWQARARAGKLLVSPMRRLGWTGPRTMRIERGTTASGYWRLPCAPRSREVEVDAEVDQGLSDDLPTALEHVTRLSLRKLARILRIPVDDTDGNLLRAQVTAAGIAVNAQLRADEQRLRAKVTGDVLEKLLRAIDRTRGRVVESGDGEATSEVEAFSLGELAADRS